MLPRQKSLIQRTWARLAPTAEHTAAIFYLRLFEIDPSARALFRNADVTQRRKRLIQVLTVAVSSLDNLGALSKTAENFGRSHAGSGVKDSHHDSFGVALMWTLEQGLGGDWTPEVAAAWKEFYGLLSTTMRQAQQEAAAARAA
jgi:hemoglobin-like flavoprotein